QPKLSHTRDQLFGEFAGDVGIADDGHEIFVDPIADGVANGALFFGEETIDRVEIDSLELRSHQFTAPFTERLEAVDSQFSWQMQPYQRAGSAAWQHPIEKKQFAPRWDRWSQSSR